MSNTGMRFLATGVTYNYQALSEFKCWYPDDDSDLYYNWQYGM